LLVPLCFRSSCQRGAATYHELRKRGTSLGLGRLPGDIVIQRDNFTFYVPLVTCLVLSVVLSVILWAFNR